MVHDDPETQREDLLILLALIDDPRQVGQEMLKSERRWLRATEQRLNLSGISLLDTATMRRAELAYQLLSRDP